jgi:hypothetical protein
MRSQRPEARRRSWGLSGALLCYGCRRCASVATQPGFNVSTALPPARSGYRRFRVGPLSTPLRRWRFREPAGQNSAKRTFGLTLSVGRRFEQ